MKIIFRPLIATIVVSSLALLLSISAWADDEGNEVLRIYHVPRAEINQLRYYGDVWGLNWREDYVHIYVTPRGRRAVEKLGYTVETDHEETRRLLEFRDVDREAWRLSGVGGIPNFPCYRTVDETYETYDDLVSQFPDYVEKVEIGNSYEVEPMYALVLANQNSPYEQAPLVIMAAQHARELTTAETATRFAELLLQERENDGDIAWLLDHREVHIIAQQNPDGRRAVEQIDLNQRKNMNTNHCPGNVGGNFSQTGVDLNRNSTMLWGGANGDPQACSLQYRGSAPASEPETQAVQTYFEDVFERWWPPDASPPGGPGTPAVPNDARGIFISIHSYAEYILFPWEGLADGAANHSPNHNQLAYLGRKFGYHTGYRAQREFIYPAAGTMVDYAYGEFGVAAFTYEVGTSFQQTCSSFENTIWPDVREALLYAAKAAEQPYQAPSGPDVINLDATYNSTTRQVQVTATADGTRYDDGGAGEDPFTDPVFDITGAVASLDVPPQLAAETFDLTLDGTGTVADLSVDIPWSCDTEQPRLLFVTATDAGGYTGVPTASWVDGLPSPQPPGELLVETQAHDFGEIGVGDAASVIIAVSNAPEACQELILDGFELTGDDFVLGDGCPAGTVLEAGASCDIEVIFSPATAGAFLGELTIEAADGADGQNAAVALSGNGVQDPGELEVLPQSLDFGEVNSGDHAMLAVTVSNAAAEGAADLVLTPPEIVVGEDVFAIDAAGGDCGKTLAPLTSCTVSITYSPETVAVHSGVARIGAQGESAINVSLSGSGIDPGSTVFEDRFEQ